MSSSDKYFFYSNPYDVVNVLIYTGNKYNIDVNTTIEDLEKKIAEIIPLDKLDTAHLSLAEYRQARDHLLIDSEKYFELTKSPGKIGYQLKFKNFELLKIAHELYQLYRDPRARDETVLNKEKIMDSIIRQGKLLGRNEQSPSFEIPLSKVSIPSYQKVNSARDLPSLQWIRTEESSKKFSIVLLKVVFSTLKKGWLIDVELIRLLNIVDKTVLKQIINNLSVFIKSRITVSLQRLADFLYLEKFGHTDEVIASGLVDDMFEKPIEDRGNLPESQALETVKFLNYLRKEFRDFAQLSDLSRKIGVLTKSIDKELMEFQGFNTVSDAIREILSVIHYSQNNRALTTQIDSIYSLITDPDFKNIARYYFDPSFELLHAPFLTSIASTKEKMKVMKKKGVPGEELYTDKEIEEISEIQDFLHDYLREREDTQDLVNIWLKLNGFLEPQVESSIENRSRSETLEMIKGKEILLNIMTPLLLAKYEGRGYNPLAANVDESFQSRLKSITGIIALASNLHREDLENLLETMFVEAPELKTSKSSGNAPPSPDKSPPTPGKPAPSVPNPTTPKPKTASDSSAGSNLIPTKMGLALARIANEYVTGGGERNLHKALVDLIAFTKMMEKRDMR